MNCSVCGKITEIKFYDAEATLDDEGYYCLKCYENLQEYFDDNYEKYLTMQNA